MEIYKYFLNIMQVIFLLLPFIIFYVYGNVLRNYGKYIKYEIKILLTNTKYNQEWDSYNCIILNCMDVYFQTLDIYY